MSDEHHSWRSRSGKISVAVAFLVLTAWTACFRFPIVWQWFGIGEGDKPFLDLYGLLAGGERAVAGFDVSQPNPLDPYHRPNVYPAWWLVIGKWGLTRADTPWLGVLLVGATLVTTLALLKPGTRREAFGVMGVLLSPALLMAVNRANNDLVIFLLVSAALAALRGQSGFWNWCAVVLFAIAAVLKYYPVAGAVVLLHGRNRREFFLGALLYGLVLAVAWPGVTQGLIDGNPFKLRPEWFYALGAPVFWRNFHLEAAILWIIPASIVLSWSALRTRGNRTGSPLDCTTTEAREFLVGSTFIVACFFLGASYAYKLVFALWLLPWLWRGAHPGPFARFTRIATWLLYAVLWFEGLGALAVNLLVIPLTPQAAPAVAYCVLTVQQLLTWMLIACLLRWIFGDVFSRVREMVGWRKAITVAPA